MILIWDDNAPPVSDSKAMQFIRDNANKSEVRVSTSTMFIAARYLHLMDEISIKHIQFKDEIIQISEYGVPKEWPSGMSDYYSTLLSDICIGAMNKRKAKKKQKLRK